MTPALCNVDDTTFWAWHRWPEFARWKNPGDTVVVIPLAGFCDWGLGRPLDAEETVLLSVLRAASESRAPEQSLLVTPPLRFVVGPGPHCVFAVDVPTAHAFIADVVASVAAARFRRVVLFNASPSNEELVVAASRDLRIALGVAVFTIHLSALGLDFQPTRTPDRTRVVAALDRGGDAAAADQLRALLAEIQNHPPLADGGRIRAVQP